MNLTLGRVSSSLLSLLGAERNEKLVRPTRFRLSPLVT